MCTKCVFLLWIWEILDKNNLLANRMYWYLTEVFCWLHDGKDYCKTNG